MTTFQRNRRGILTAGGLAGVAGVVGLATDMAAHSATAKARRQQGSVLPQADARGRASVQIVAHPDDDLFFLNPEVVQSVRAGIPTTTIYLMAAEADGKNAPKAAKTLTKADFPGYVGARQAGLRLAYSAMATGRPDAAWARTVLITPAGTSVEVDRLRDRPEVALLFLNLSRRDPAGRFSRLRDLWLGAGGTVITLPPTGTAARTGRTYNRVQLLRELTGLLGLLRPSVVRTMDPDPERGHDVSGWDGRTDHQDHTATALFTRAAVGRHEQAHAGPVLSVYYRGYYNRHWPHNLDEQAVAGKLAYIGLYAGSAAPVPGRTATPAAAPTVGDRQVTASGVLTGWPQSTHHRYPGSTTWLRRLADGRLTAVGVISGRVVRWTGDATGRRSGWRGPTAISDHGFLPEVHTVRLPDGRLLLLGVRVTETADPAAPAYQVMLAQQADPAGEFGRWTGLGNPAGAGTAFQRDVGMPAAAVDGTGLVTVFCRNSGRGVSARTQSADGTFGPWRDLGGTNIQEGIAAATGPDGAIVLYGATVPQGWSPQRPGHSVPGLWRWRQEAPGRPITGPGSRLAAGAAVTGPLTLAPDRDGNLVLLCREAGTAATLMARDSGAPVTVAGPGGFGPVGAVAAPDGTLWLAGRDDAGGVGILGAGTWAHAPVLHAHAPSIEITAAGLPVAAVLGVNGRLSVLRQRGTLWTSSEVKG